MCKIGLPLALLLVVGTVSVALADDRDHKVRAELSGYNEVHFVAGPPAALRGAVSTVARGKFKATIESNQLIRYQLSYEGLEGAVTQAHIHFGQPHTAGGIVVWLCETSTNQAPPEPVQVRLLTPECPPEATEDTPVTGTIEPVQVLAQTDQGIVAGEFAELIRAIRAGATYANVHSSKFGPGEIRCQIHDGIVGKVLDFLGRGRDD